MTSNQAPKKAPIIITVDEETAAIHAAKTLMQDALQDFPLSKPLLVYALCELACELVSDQYAEEVINEIRVLREIDPDKAAGSATPSAQTDEPRQQISQDDAIELLRSAATRLEFFALNDKLPTQEVISYALMAGFKTMPHKIRRA